MTAQTSYYRPTAQLKIALTARCTNDCRICFNDTRRRDNGRRVDLDIGVLHRAIDDAAAMGVVGVYFSGGEPLLRYGELLELGAHARALGLAATVVTNAGPLGGSGRYREQNAALFHQAGCAHLAPEQMVDALATAGLRRVFISVDSHHNTLRGCDRAPADRVPTEAVARAMDALLDAGFGQPDDLEAIGHRLRVSLAASGPSREPSWRVLEDVFRRLALVPDVGAHGALRWYRGTRGSVLVKLREVARLGAATGLPSSLLEQRCGTALGSIRCANMRAPAHAYDGGLHHQDISINHDGVVALCGNFMYPIGELGQHSLHKLVGRVNQGQADGPYSGSIAVLHRLFALSQQHGFGECAIGQAFRLIVEDAPELLAPISTEGGACHALGRDPRLQACFIRAFDARFA